MSKLEQLRQAIDDLPPEYREIWSTASYLLERGALDTLNAYINGARTMVLALTSDENLLKPLSDIKELLK